MKTRILTSKEIVRAKHEIDAEGKVLGRLATEVADLLMGKGKVLNSANLVAGDKVTIFNASKVVVTGNRAKQKIYHGHSGWPRGEKEESLAHLLERKPTEVLRKAVKGMLPNNKLRDDRIKLLKIYGGNKG